VVNTHFHITDDTKVSNADETLGLIRDEEYFILCGDFNVDAIDRTTALYQSTLKKFVDAGYKLCNGGEMGDFITYPNTGEGIDNIIVSPNINIKSVVVDTQKSYLGSGANQADHYPLIAYLEIF
jgi:endonuclease/exonuclease/phosphatase family metal-dependent hydrolase